MEDLLQQIVKEASVSTKYSLVETASQETHDFLEAQQGTFRPAAHELRRRCCEALQLTLESHNPRLITLAITGFHKLLRDDRFLSHAEEETEEQWLPSQLLSAVCSLQWQPENTQIDILKVLMHMSCAVALKLNEFLIVRILSVCQEANDIASEPVSVASQATASQIIRAFCDSIGNDQLHSNDCRVCIQDTDSAFDVIVPVMHHLCKNILEKQSIKSQKKSQFSLECLLTFVSALPERAVCANALNCFLWQELCPTLLSLLGPPISDKDFSNVSEIFSAKELSLTRNTFGLTNSMVKTVCSICVELVRLVGSFEAFRPMLESTFHRMLLFTSNCYSLEALRVLKEVMKSPERLITFAGPPLISDPKTCCSTDLGLMKLAMSSVVSFSQCSETLVCHASIDCVATLLESLERICEGWGLTSNYTQRLNSLYEDLESCDYKGPLTYQTWEKLHFVAPLVVSQPSDVNNAHIACIEDFHCDRPNKGDYAVETGGKLNELGYETDSSGDTEGPEDECETRVTSCQCFDDLCGVNDRHRKIPRELLVVEDGKTKREEIARLYEKRELFVQHERENARQFFISVKNSLPSWLNVRSSIEVDEILQEFASVYCKNSDGCLNLRPVIINGDGIYFALYSSLLLNLKLIKLGYYRGDVEAPPLTEEEFIKTVHDSGVLVYLSSDWLAELYQQVLDFNILGFSGYDHLCRHSCALINLLNDLEGTDGSKFLFDYCRLEKTVNNSYCEPDKLAGAKFARRILTACWDEMLSVLSALLNEKAADGKSSVYFMLSTDNAKEEYRKAREAIASSLDGLQRVARLCSLLNLHTRCECVFALLSSVSCSMLTTPGQNASRYRKKLTKTAALLGWSYQLKLHIAHVLSMEVILSEGLALGSYNSDCWKHVFRCCLYLSEIEHLLFNNGLCQTVVPGKVSLQKMTDVFSARSKQIRCHLKGVSMEESSVFPFIFGSVTSSVADYLKQNFGLLSSSGLLSSEQSTQVLCLLSQQVDKLFDDAAYKLNLRALVGFLTELCSASRAAVFANDVKCSFSTNKLQCEQCSCSVMLLHRLCDVMLKCLRSGRPLIHIMQAWSICGLHLMEAACHKTTEIAKHAVTYIHLIVSSLLVSQPELPHFHFNEALFKPFENVLCLDLCDGDIQDQIISSICEFVETSKLQICSGWRPLFGALRAVCLADVASGSNSVLNSNRIHGVLDVFEAFFKMDNVLVFANAAVDCILCLLKYIKNSSDSEIAANSDELCLASLNYIQKCCGILSSMHAMSSCPVFNSYNRFQLVSGMQFVDSQIPNYIFVEFDSQNSSQFGKIGSGKGIDLNLLRDGCKTLNEMEHASGILHVWCLILEGLMCAVVTCPKRCQPPITQTVFHILAKISDMPGIDFSLYVVNHLFLPTLQSWLRRVAKTQCFSDSFVCNFKQCSGQVTDVVVDYIMKMSDCSFSSTKGELLLYQLFVLMIECIAQPHESISHLGCSCMRHVVFTSGHCFTTKLWDVTCAAFQRACSVSLFGVRQLMTAFRAHSENFYGDTATVKVCAAADATFHENNRLKQIAQQVFLLENQQSLQSVLLDDCVDDDRSYSFLLYSQPLKQSEDPETLFTKVSFRLLLIGLVSHQILLQTIASLLLHKLRRVVPSLANVLFQTLSYVVPSSEGDLKNAESLLSELPDCLKESYYVTCQFDARPALKFLVQKVARIGAAANLYKQSGASWTIRAVALLELCLHQLDRDEINATKKSTVEHLKTGEFCFVQLNTALQAMCDSYGELFTKDEEHEDVFVCLQDQPVFFLVANTDDYMENRLASSNSPPPKEELGAEELDVISKSEVESPPESAQDAFTELQLDPVERHSPLKSDVNKENRVCIYEVATQKDIDSMVSEYKKHKQNRCMPSVVKTDGKKRSTPECEATDQRQQEVAQLPSLLKDHQACIKVHTEMLLSMFDIFCQLDDKQFEQLLPITFPFVRSLVGFGRDRTLCQTLAEFLDRVARLYGFASDGN